MSIYDRILEIRQYFGLSQTQFAKKINRTSSFVSSIENRKCEVSDDTINTICSLFNINKSWLINGDGDMFVKGYEVSRVDRDNVGKRVKQIRKENHLTQDEFASIVGYSKIQIHYVEANKVRPSNDFLKKVAGCFNVSYDWLMTGVGNLKAKEAVVDDKLIDWLKKNPDIVKELRVRSGLDKE